MKNYICVLFALTFNAFAANPDQDLIVDMVRERFAASVPARLADLKIGKTWRCVIYSGQRGIMPNYNTIRENFRFKEVEGKSQVINELSFPFKTYDVDAASVSSTLGEYSLHIRVAHNGALVFEKIGPQPTRHKAYRSITDHNLRGLDYIYCK